MNMVDIESNKERFNSLIDSIEIGEFNKEAFKDFLEQNNFYIAPATSLYSYSFDGGLCQHSLDVYDTLNFLCANSGEPIDDNSIKLVALFHDIYKMCYYEKTTVNKKIYSENGSKRDNAGKFDWVSVEGYKIREAKDRPLYGDNAFTSYMLLSKFIPLTDVESVAIVNHNCGMDNGYSNKDMSHILANNHLAVLLHCADMICTYTQSPFVLHEDKDEYVDDDDE